MKAIQLGLLNQGEVEDFIGGDIGKDAKGNLVMATPKGPVKVSIGDWVIKNKGEVFAIKPELFREIKDGP